MKKRILLGIWILSIIVILSSIVNAGYLQGTPDHMDAGYNSSFWKLDGGTFYTNDTIVYEGPGSIYLKAGENGYLINLTSVDTTCAVRIYFDGCKGGIVSGLQIRDTPYSESIFFCSKANTNPGYWTYYSGSGYVDTGIPIVQDQWNELAVTYWSNDTTILYLNGANILNFQYSGPNTITGVGLGTFSTASDCPVLFDYFRCWTGTYTDEPSVGDTTPPTNSSWKVTSGNVVYGQDTTAWNYGGTINITSDSLSLNVTTDESSNGSCVLDHDWNYTYTINQSPIEDGIPVYKFPLTDTTDHFYIVYDDISIGNHCLYCSFIDSSGNEFTHSSSGCLPVYRLSISAPNVTLISPADSSADSDGIINFTFKAVTDSSLVNCSLFGNWSGWEIKQTIYNVLNDTTTNFSLVTLPKGSYGWNAECCDENHLCNFSGNNYTFTVLNQPPSHTTPVLNSSLGYNSTTDDLVCHNQSTYDTDNDKVTNIYSWYRDSSSFASLNLPFETDADDYSGNNNNGVVYNAALVAGKYGNAYSFDGDDYIHILDSSSLDFTNAKSWELWLKRDSTGAQALFDKSNAANQRNYKLEFDADNKLVFSYSIAGGAGAESWLTKTQADFNEGSYSNIIWDTEHVELSPGQGSGTYISAIFDANSSSSWDSIDWREAIPYGEELPDNKGSDSGADMTGNVLLLHMNEASGTIVDYSGEGNSGTYNGGLYSQSGKLNTAIGFDGINDAVTIGASSSLDIGPQVSVEVWLYPRSCPTQASPENYDAFTFIETQSGGYHRGIWGNGSCQIYLQPGAGTGAAQQTNIEYPLNQWTHLAVNYYQSGSDVIHELYIDGVLKDNHTYSSTTLWSNAGYYKLGSDSLGRYLDGTLDELAIYNRTLSATEILNHYKRGALRLNLTARSCDDVNCSGENFINIIDNPPQSLSVDDNRYFQYKFNFETDDISYSPELYNVTVDYTLYGANIMEVNITSNSSVTDTNWHHTGITYGNNNLKLYLDGSLDNSKTETNLPQHKDNDLYISRDYSGSSYFAGDVDEVRIYDRALSAQQIQAHYNLEYNKIVSQELSPSDTWVCKVTPNDGFVDGETKQSNNLTIIGNIFDITFKVVDSYSGEQISTTNNLNIDCTNNWAVSGVNNPYGPVVFYEGTYSCTFTGSGVFDYYDKTITFTADADKTIDVSMSKRGWLTPEEHFWLESVYDCLYGNVSCNI